ncbi:hypothetical protein RHSIM_Rhsim11G0069100 [Rhododendron simsii]|uniref:F-box domain-containing protein n=1 Tax=Rhododendron simsii TaxID=118357 RepID=A0A834LBD6_RHOSS|nr:hypothetical protein RHSIM_Rhsim11G0069100 [Rhododendron simsii]
MTMITYSRKKTKPIADGTPPETSPAAELIANNVDLLTQILLHIPAKSIIRFKSVSKHWLSLVSDSRFASTHSRLNPRPLISSLYFYYNEKKLESVSLNGSSTAPSLSFLRPLLHRLTGDFTILQSCNGLLLIRDKQIVDRLVKSRYTVCNPTTQRFHVLARHGGRFYEPCFLAFDPSKSPHYKIALLINRFYMDIYSSETACWKKIVLPNGQMDRCYGNGVFWNGALYWLCDQCNVLRFDVETEKIVGIPYAQHSSSSSRILSPDRTRYFGECGRGGRLLLIQSHSHSTVRFNIWEMDEDCCRWNVKLLVDLKTLISEFLEIETLKWYKFTLMCAVEGEKEDDDIALILAIPGKIISCNPQKSSWKVLRDLAPGEYSGFIKDGYTYASVFPFAESLSPV